MEGLEGLLHTLSGVHPAIPIALAALGSLVVVAQVVVAVTPSTADNEFMAKLEAVPLLGSILRALKSFAPLQKK